MKPPPRATRAKSFHRLSVPQLAETVTGSWTPEEKKKLVLALKRLGSKTTAGQEDMDYAFLRKYVPTRSIPEIERVVERLKNKVISCASFKLNKKRSEEQKVRKPIEEWTHMASSLAGTLEETISTAFSQMMLVSSTEPCTLKNCDPPQVHRPPTDDGPAGRTITLRPMPMSARGEHRRTKKASPVHLLKTPAPTIGPAKRLQAPAQIFRVQNSTVCPSQQPASPTFAAQPGASPRTASPRNVPDIVQPSSTSDLSSVIQAASEQHPTAVSITPTSMPSSSDTPLCSSVPSSGSSTVASTCSATSSCHSTPHTLPQSPSPTARFGRTSKYATKDSPRTFGVKCVVDFERIYRFLSVIQKPDEHSYLTAMESAIVLDLLMSLPEELHLLDRNKLHKHMIQVYHSLSALADSKMAKEMFKDLKDGLFTQMEAQSAQDVSGTDIQRSTAGTADSTDVMDGEGRESHLDEAGNQSSQSHNMSKRLEESDVIGPPLNPFIVPLAMLKRREMEVTKN